MANLISSLKSFKINDCGKQDLLLDTNLQVRSRGRLFNCFHDFRKDKVAYKIHQNIEKFFKSGNTCNTADLNQIKENLEKFKTKLTSHKNNKNSKEFNSAIMSLSRSIEFINKINSNKVPKQPESKRQTSRPPTKANASKPAETIRPNPAETTKPKPLETKNFKPGIQEDPNAKLVRILSTAIDTSGTKKKGLTFAEASEKLIEMLKKTIEENYKNFKFNTAFSCPAGLNVTFTESPRNGAFEFLGPKTYLIPRHKIENLENLQTLTVGGIRIDVLAHLKASELFKKQQGK